MEKKLYRNENDKMIAGVASGLAEHLNIDATLVRLGFVIAVFAAFGGILIYIILWIVIPPKPYNVSADYKIYNEKATPLRGDLDYSARKQGNGRFIGGMILIIMGALFLFREFHLLPYWVSLHRLWPLALIVPGIMILTKSRKTEPTKDRSEPWNKKQETDTSSTITESTTTPETPADSTKPMD